MKALRLQAFLARAGVASRRKAEDLIREGRVRVNGKVAVLGQKVGPEDLVEVDGKRVELPQKRLVLALHKPKGYTTTRHDPHARRTVFDLLPKIPGLHPVGRLDRDSEGLLLLTNDGDLTHRLTHPRHKVAKRYLVHLERPVGPKDQEAFREGILLDGKKTLPAELTPLEDPTWAEVVLKEGRFHQIKRMFRARGNRVLRLKRLALGPLELGDLPPGKARPLTEAEEKALYAAVGLGGEDPEDEV